MSSSPHDRVPAADPAPTAPSASEAAPSTEAADALTSSLAQVLTPQGWDLLQSLPPYDEANALSLGAALRDAGHSPELVSAVLTQSRLRARADDKFGEFASTMLLTPDGLEQATRLPLAALHARRFLDAGITSILDVGCGIGGDAMAAAALGLDVTAIDRDPATVAVATVNLQPFERARAQLGAAEDLDVHSAQERGQGIWMDPARRAARGGASSRRHRPEDYSPPLSAVVDIARRLGTGGHDGPLGAKLGPGIPHEALPPGTETQWISWHGQVLEADCWFGPLARPGTARSALVIDAQGAHRLDAPAVPGTRPDTPPADPAVGPVRSHLYEPDGAVIRAGLLGVIAESLDATTIDPTIAYLTSDAEITTPFARGYTIREVMPFGLKRLTAYLRERHLGDLEIKKRGTAITPEELRRRLRPQRFGHERATVILTRIDGDQSVIIATPHPRPPSSAPGGQV